MQHPGFFHRAGPFTVAEISAASGAEILFEQHKTRLINDVKSLHEAGPSDLAFFENRKYLAAFGSTKAGACIVARPDMLRAPDDTAVLASSAPYQSFARVLTLFYPEALRTKVASTSADSNGTLVHATARISESAIIEPGAVVGREANIGADTVVAAGAVVGYRVIIGRSCYIGPGATVTHAIIGDSVIIHAGARLGQDGFGFVMSNSGHLKVPQIGRVLIGDGVEIGANSTIDRGSLSDTAIGEGTKIDNLVQIAHNVVIGRHCVIVAQSGVAGSAQLGDFVIMGAHSGVIDHVTVGSGAQVAGMAHVKNDVQPGARMGGTPARPFKEWAREVAALRQLGKKS
jgi:UDP-3-O-[3-hydroxymyristoyl] glucosamine N-acyltransferase